MRIFLDIEYEHCIVYAMCSTCMDLISDKTGQNVHNLFNVAYFSVSIYMVYLHSGKCNQNMAIGFVMIVAFKILAVFHIRASE